MLAKMQQHGYPSLGTNPSSSDLLAEIECLAQATLARANDLRDRIADSTETDLDEVSQLSLALDTLLQLKIAKDLLEQQIALDMTQIH